MIIYLFVEKITLKLRDLCQLSYKIAFFIILSERASILEYKRRIMKFILENYILLG